MRSAAHSDIEGLGEKLVDQLVEGDVVRSLPDLYRLDLATLRATERMAEKSARNLLDALQRAKRTTLARFLYGLGIRHVGEATERPGPALGQLDALMAASVERLLQVNDVGPIVAQAICDFLPKHTTARWCSSCAEVGVVWDEAEPAQAAPQPLAGQTVVLTGTLPTLARAGAGAAGGGGRQGGRFGEQNQLHHRGQ